MKKKLIIGFLILSLLGVISLFGLYKYVESNLPQIMKVEDYNPLLVSQVFDRNGKKIGEFTRQKRMLVPFERIPKNIIYAFLAAEDDSFFEHDGINYFAILRATLANLRAGHTVQGASTITQQVAKTFFLSSERTYLRKITEAILAKRLEANLTKEQILYLYLNQIFFGQGAYGISTAAETYFRKPVDNLTLAEMAILAGLPKAPSICNPISKPSCAKDRQVYVLRRMADVGYISQDDAEKAAAEPVKVYVRERFEANAPFFLEMVRQMLIAKFGEKAVLDEGLKIYTTIELSKQIAAQDAMKMGLKELDKRQGFRGPLGNTVEPREVGEFLLKSRNKLISEYSPERILEANGQFRDFGPLDIHYDLKNGLPVYLPLGNTSEGIISRVDDQLGLIFVRISELEGVIDFESMQWARKPNSDKRFDLDTLKKPSQALKTGDIVLLKVVSDKFVPDAKLSKMITDAAKAKKPIEIDFTKYIGVELDQEPIAEGSLFSIDQNTQEVLAHVGGYNFIQSKWDKVLQAARQTGSSFKPIVYLSALDKGYTPATSIMDAPIVYEEIKEDEEGQEDTKIWKPDNHSKSFSGDIIFRNALVKSLNVPTVKIVEDITVPWIADYARRLGIFSPLNPDFTLGLGSSSITLFEMTKVFSQFGRLGKRMRPIFINKVLDASGKTVAEKISIDERFIKESEEIDKQFEDRRKTFLETLKVNLEKQNANAQDPSNASDQQAAKNHKKASAEENLFFEDVDQLIKPTTAYLITSLLKAVIDDRNGTGGRAKILGREVAGKTGTTNGYFDAWFIGFTQQIATGVWVGFERERTLGKGEVGGRAALPIWVDYMKAAHEGLPQMNIPVPNGIVFANIDSETGQLASVSSKNVIRQAFLEGTEPSSSKNKKEEDTEFYKQDLSE